MDEVSTKQCHKCGLIKPITEFHNDKTKKDGKYGYCKLCRKKVKEIYYINNKDKVKASKQRWKKENPEKYRNSKARYRQEHKDIVYAGNKRWRESEIGKAYYREYRIKYREMNREKINASAVQRRKNNPEPFDLATKKWRDNNPEKAKEVSRISSQKRRNTLFGTLNDRMSAGIRQSLKKGQKGARWETLVGYSVEQLKDHLERQFTDGMTWKNLGQWHIDHKIPKISFNYTSSDSPEFKECWSLNNLQPLWGIDNLKKGRKLIDEYVNDLGRCVNE